MKNHTHHPRDFFVAGGTLRYDAPSYVVRPADDELHHMVQAGTLCYVLTTRQMGKSSLMNRLGRQLQTEQIATALIDLTTIGTASLEEWYLSLLDDLQIQLSLATDAEDWWESELALSPVKRFTKFFRDVILAETDGQIAIFIDEVDSALNLDFSDDFFAAIRAIYNQTLTSDDAGRLSFVLLGVATPNELIKSQHRTPFNVGERIELEELDLADAQQVFSQGLPAQEPPIVHRVHHWTSGHPYLTQRVCQTIARDSRPQWSTQAVDDLVAQIFFTERALVEESNLQFVNGRILASPHKAQLLKLYQTIHKQKKPVPNDEHDPIQAELKLYGLVKAKPDGNLSVRNRIYRHVFDQAWIKQHQPTSRKRFIWAALILMTILSVGLSIYLWRQARQSQDLLAQTYISNFNATENSTLRLDNLAQLIALDGYAEEAVFLFSNLSMTEQAALFANPSADIQPQIEAVIETMYTTQGVDEFAAGADSSQVLTSMAAALQTFDRLENPTILPEIESWLEGRTAVSQNNLQAAHLSYSVALSLNENNLATRYERALVAFALPDYETALADATILLSHDASWQARVEDLLSRHPQAHALITADGSAFAELAALVPEPTITVAVPTVTRLVETAVPIRTAVPTATATVVVEDLGDVVETAVLITTRLAIPATQPEGRIIYTCFVDGFDQICSIEADGTNPRQLTITDSTNWTASFTPDLQNILFSSSRSGSFSLYQADINGDNMQMLLFPEQGDYAPVASPDGEKIAFARAENGSQNIWIMDRDGSNPHAITAIIGDAIHPTWSPDSQQIAYGQRLTGEEEYTFIILNADGTELRTLSLPLTGIGGRADWSPDGNWLAIYAGPTNNRDIYLVATDGKAYYQLTNGGDNLSPSFSPDGNWLVFTSSRDGDNDLYLIRLDGTGLTQLTANDSPDWQPFWGN